MRLSWICFPTSRLLMHNFDTKITAKRWVLGYIQTATLCIRVAKSMYNLPHAIIASRWNVTQCSERLCSLQLRSDCSDNTPTNTNQSYHNEKLNNNCNINSRETIIGIFKMSLTIRRIDLKMIINLYEDLYISYRVLHMLDIDFR